LQHAEEGNQSVSVLSFVPVIDDDGKYLTCRAENPEINDSALEDRWRLNVHCEYHNALETDVETGFRKRPECLKIIIIVLFIHVTRL
jgi:hypothetical protein